MTRQAVENVNRRISDFCVEGPHSRESVWRPTAARYSSAKWATPGQPRYRTGALAQLSSFRI
eukprot:7070702-Prymnesium_polylepis.1